MSVRRISGVLSTFILLVLTVGLYLYRQEVIDWLKLRNYEPSAAISRLSVDSSFSDKGRKLFYVHYPELLEKSAFQGKCTQTEETIVLGCYITDSKIYVFDVSDERLYGVEEVTAAHEMLHAAYDRLDTEQKNRIDRLLSQVFESSEDARLKQTIDSYRARDPSVVANELHSIIGTEIRDIPQELEDYYTQYFLDRSMVVDLAEDYAAEFEQREVQIEAFDEQLAQLDLRIKEVEANRLQLEVALERELQQLESLRNDPSAYNEQVPIYNLLVEDYNSLVIRLRDLIDTYNQLVEERNEIASQERDLLEAIDARAKKTE